MVGMRCTSSWFYGYLALKKQIVLLIMYMHAVIYGMSYVYFQECTRKESEYSSNAVTFKEKYHSVCRQMGIKVRIKAYNSCQKSCFRVFVLVVAIT